MGIENLLAQGYQPRQIEPYGNALMRAQDFKTRQAQLANALMQGEDMHAQRALALQQAQQAAAERARMEQWRQSIPSPQMAAQQQALAGGGGPTIANAAQVRPVDPRLQALHGGMGAGVVSPMDYLKEAYPKQDLMTVAPGAAVIDKNKPGNAVFTAPIEPKAADIPSAVREYQFAVGQGYKGSFEQWDTTRKKAGATSVSVNTGQKGYENESKLRNDFKSEPIYKDFQDMDQAYKQIKSGLSAANPIGDVAAATKIMKLLDPGSVVRESELAIAMSAAGKLDRLQNFVQMQVTGQKLTPTQRKEFAALAGELHSAAAQSYNAKRKEYETMGSRYGLDPAVLGSESKPLPSGGLSPSEAKELEQLRARFKGK